MRETRQMMTHVVILGVIGIAGVSQGAVIVDYDFVNNSIPASNTGSVAATTVAANVSSTPINGGVGAGGAGAGNGGGTNGSGLLVDFTTNGGYSGGGEFLRAATNGTTGAQATEAGAVSTADYWNFVVTPTAGTAMNFSDISITGARGGASTPRGFYIESSIDNPGNVWGTKDIFGIGSEQSQRPTLTTYNVGNYTTYLAGGSNSSYLGTGSLNLSSNSAYQNVTSPIEFRIYVIAPANGNSIDFTDFDVNGTVTGAPEPAAMGLIGLGSLGFLARRRRSPC